MLKFRRAPSLEDSARSANHDPFFDLVGRQDRERLNLGLSFAAGSPRKVAVPWKSWGTRLNTSPTSMQMTLQTRDRWEAPTRALQPSRF